MIAGIVQQTVVETLAKFIDLSFGVIVVLALIFSIVVPFFIWQMRNAMDVANLRLKKIRDTLGLVEGHLRAMRGLPPDETPEKPAAKDPPGSP